MQLPLSQLIRSTKKVRELPNVSKRPKLSDYFNPQPSTHIISELQKLKKQKLNQSGQGPTQKKPKKVYILPMLGDQPLTERVEEEYRVNWKEEQERRANPGGSMFKFFSSMWDERAELDAEFVAAYKFITEKLNKLEKWEKDLENRQLAESAEIFTQSETIELSITGSEVMNTNVSDGS